jgi:hypothetical protein
MLTVYRADLPRTLALVVGLSLAVPAASVVARALHSTDSTIVSNLDRKPSEAALTAVCEKCRRELPIANLIDRIRKVE